MIENTIYYEKLLQWITDQHKVGTEEYRKGVPIDMVFDPWMSTDVHGYAMTTLKGRRIEARIGINPMLKDWEAMVLTLLHEIGHVMVDVKEWHSGERSWHGKPWQKNMAKLGVKIEVVDAENEEDDFFMWKKGKDYTQEFYPWKRAEILKWKTEFDKIWLKNRVNWMKS